MDSIFTQPLILVVDKNNFFRSVVVEKFLSDYIVKRFRKLLSQTYHGMGGWGGYEPVPIERSFPIVLSAGIAEPESKCNNITEREFWNEVMEQIFRDFEFDIEKLKHRKFLIVGKELLEKCTYVYALDTEVHEFLNKHFELSASKLYLISELKQTRFNFEDLDEPSKGKIVTPESIKKELDFIKKFCLGRQNELINEPEYFERMRKFKASEIGKLH